MSFTNPQLLILLAVPAILLTWAWQRRGWGILLPFDHQEHKQRRWLTWLLSFFESLPALVLACLILILSGPQVLRRPSNERVLTNIQICVDVSGSMTIQRRYEMATEAVQTFVSTRDGDAFGLTLFGSYPIRWVPLTKDLQAIRNALPYANPQNQPRHMGGTRIGEALRFCLGNMVVEATQGDRMIILVSDGMSSDIGDSGTAMSLADELSASGITVYHVHVGNGSVPAVVQDLARETGGEAFVATDQKGLDRIFQRIDQMQPARFAPGGTVPMDFFTPFALVGLVALGAHLVGLIGMRYTPW